MFEEANVFQTFVWLHQIMCNSLIVCQSQRISGNARIPIWDWATEGEKVIIALYSSVPWKPQPGSQIEKNSRGITWVSLPVGTGWVPHWSIICIGSVAWTGRKKLSLHTVTTSLVRDNIALQPERGNRGNAARNCNLGVINSPKEIKGAHLNACTLGMQRGLFFTSFPKAVLYTWRGRGGRID